jgi:hypothetical protein
VLRRSAKQRGAIIQFVTQGRDSLYPAPEKQRVGYAFNWKKYFFDYQAKNQAGYIRSALAALDKLVNNSRIPP